jgi:transposase
VSYQYFEGVDLFAIEGVSYSTVLTIMSEVGLEGLKKFETAKQFASWLRLAPNNKISGGKVLSHKVPKGKQQVKNCLTQCSQCNRKFEGYSSFKFLQSNKLPKRKSIGHKRNSKKACSNNMEHGHKKDGLHQ